MKSRSNAPERIGIMGIAGVGKTQAWADWAATMRETGEGTVYVLNAGIPGDIDRLSDGWQDFHENVVFFDLRNWIDVVLRTRDILSLVQPGDLVVLEGADRPWQWVRDSYVAHKAGVKPKEWTVESLWETAKMPELKGGDYAEQINPEYLRWWSGLLDKDSNPAHLLCTALAKPIILGTGKAGEWKTDEDNVALFSHVAMMPDAQKKFGPDLHTVLLLQKDRTGHTFTTAKDRVGRVWQKDAPMLSLPLSYLCAVGHWEL